jgi:hypothetical protein
MFHAIFSTHAWRPTLLSAHRRVLCFLFLSLDEGKRCSKYSYTVQHACTQYAICFGVWKNNRSEAVEPFQAGQVNGPLHFLCFSQGRSREHLFRWTAESQLTRSRMQPHACMPTNEGIKSNLADDRFQTPHSSQSVSVELALSTSSAQVVHLELQNMHEFSDEL